MKNKLILMALALGICVAALSGCAAQVGTALVLSAVSEMLRVEAISMPGKPMVYVKADDYPAENFDRDLLCVQATVRGQVGAKDKKAIGQDINTRLADAFSQRGFPVANDGCDVRLNAVYTLKKVKASEPPRVSKVRVEARKDGKKVYLARMVAFQAQPLDESVIGFPADAVGRMRDVYRQGVSLEPKLGAGLDFWKSDRYHWERFEDETVCSTVKVTGNIPEDKREDIVRFTWGGVWTTYKEYIGDAEPDPNDEDCTVWQDVEMNVWMDPSINEKEPVSKDIFLQARVKEGVIYKIALHSQTPANWIAMGNRSELPTYEVNTVRLAQELED